VGSRARLIRSILVVALPLSAFAMLVGILSALVTSIPR
jgi:hypothetical protein